MSRQFVKSLAVLSLIALVGGCASSAPNTAPVGSYANPAPASSWTDPFKKSSDAVAAVFSPPVDKARDPIALTAGTDKPKGDFFVEAARVYEQNGNFKAAATEYEKTLKSDPKNVPALLGYAHLKDRQGQLPEATQLYEQAVKAQPKEAGAHNDLAICLARRGMLDQAAVELNKAVELQPKKPLYRNNLAQIKVQQRRYEEAFHQLRAVQGDAVAYYNLGYLIEQKGDTRAAIEHLTQALRIDPKLVPAQQMLDHLTAETAVARREPAPATMTPSANALPTLSPLPVNNGPPAGSTPPASSMPWNRSSNVESRPSITAPVVEEVVTLPPELMISGVRRELESSPIQPVSYEEAAPESGVAPEPPPY